MIKAEMLNMLRHDLLKHPSGQIAKATHSKLLADFKPYDFLTEEEMQEVISFRTIAFV
jgi:hypothetical protein